MIDHYIASWEDLEAIEEALEKVWNPTLNFVFEKRKLISSTVVVSYDSKYLYLWVPLGNKRGQYSLQKISHNLSLPPKYHYAWYTGLWEKVEELLPSSIKKTSRFSIPRIGGGLLTPFITLQKSHRIKINPYTTKESYLATIVHEFGHVYWNQHKLWWFSDKKENLRYIRQAIKTNRQHVYLPLPFGIGELYAFCAEYSVSTIFWPAHRNSLDKFIKKRLKILTNVENVKNLNQEDSVIEPNKNPHDFALVFVKIILALYPQQWPEKLTSRARLAGPWRRFRY